MNLPVIRIKVNPDYVIDETGMRDAEVLALNLTTGKMRVRVLDINDNNRRIVWDTDISSFYEQFEIVKK